MTYNVLVIIVFAFLASLVLFALLSVVRHAFLVHILAGRLGSAHCLFVRECVASSPGRRACGGGQIARHRKTVPCESL